MACSTEAQRQVAVLHTWRGRKSAGCPDQEAVSRHPCLSGGARGDAQQGACRQADVVLRRASRESRQQVVRGRALVQEYLTSYSQRREGVKETEPQEIAGSNRTWWRQKHTAGFFHGVVPSTKVDCWDAIAEDPQLVSSSALFFLSCESCTLARNPCGYTPEDTVLKTRRMDLWLDHW